MRARFLLFQRHRHNAVVLETIAGKPILVLPEVLNPRLFLTGEFLAEALNQGAGSYANNRPSQMLSTLIPPGSIVLDMGTGSGVGAVFAAQTPPGSWRLTSTRRRCVVRASTCFSITWRTVSTWSRAICSSRSPICAST